MPHPHSLRACDPLECSMSAGDGRVQTVRRMCGTLREDRVWKEEVSRALDVGYDGAGCHRHGPEAGG